MTPRMPIMELLYQLCYGLTVLGGVGLGLFVLWKNSRSRVNVTWGLMNGAVALWAFACTQSFFEPNYGKALFMSRLANYSATLIPAFFTRQYSPGAMVKVDDRQDVSPVG